MDPLTFHNMVSYNWDLHDAGFRAMQAIHQSIYNTQVVQPVMSPEQFTSFVQWPGVRPFIPGGGSSSGTGAETGVDAGADIGGGADTFDDIDEFDIDDQTTLRQMMDSFINKDGNEDGSDDEMDEASASDDD
jgi:hypothetical protein